MGFENRRSLRVRTNLRLCYWPNPEVEGDGRWAQALNLSETGLALGGALPLPLGHTVKLEFSLSGRKQPLQVPATVIHCDAAEREEDGYTLRLQFQALANADRLALRLYILQVADPKLAAQTGWGPLQITGGLGGIDTKYRLLSEAEQRQALQDRAFLPVKEMVFLRKFQAHLEAVLGRKDPQDLRLLGSRALKENGYAWMELNLEHGHLHLLAKVLWCRTEGEERHEAGLSVVAFQREEALKQEKQA
jgi:hypothetical protein